MTKPSHIFVWGVSEYDCMIFGIPGPEHIIARWNFESMSDRDAFMMRQMSERPEHQFEGYSGTVPLDELEDVAPDLVPASHTHAELSDLRRWAGLTQDQLADAVGVAQSKVALWESGREMPRVDRLEVMADALGCTVGLLVAALTTKHSGLKRRDG